MSTPLPDGLSFAEALQRLEALALQLEAHDQPLEAALESYEEGTHLAQYCLDRLRQAELRVQELRLE
ncbi:MAG: exodeoxyribonuclease VII small subunit [Bacteroidota bacterium]